MESQTHLGEPRPVVVEGKVRQVPFPVLTGPEDPCSPSSATPWILEGESILESVRKPVRVTEYWY